MRTLLLGLVFFLLAGFTLVLSKFGVPDDVRSALSNPTQTLVFETIPDSANDGLGVAAYRSKPEGVLILDANTPSQTAEFLLPTDALALGGSLNLSFSSQTREADASKLLIMVNNQMRGEILLRPGHDERTVKIDLTDQDLGHESLKARLSIVATDASNMCNPRSDFVSIVEIEADSHLDLEVNDPNLTARDQIALQGNTANVRWASGFSMNEQTDIWLKSLELARRGTKVHFVRSGTDKSLTKDQISFVLQQPFASQALKEELQSWPESLARFGNSGERRFHNGTAWRHWFHIGHDAHGSAPTALDYDLLLAPLPKDAQWHVTFALNNSFVGTRIEAGNVGSIEGNLPLPIDLMTESNQIEIVATSTYETEGLCNDGPELFAELRPSTVLIGDNHAVETPLNMLTAHLESNLSASVTLPEGASAIEARRALDIANDLLPETLNLNAASADLSLLFTRKKDIRETLLQQSERSSLVWLDSAGQLRTKTVETDNLDDLSEDFGALVLVIPQVGTSTLSELAE